MLKVIKDKNHGLKQLKHEYETLCKLTSREMLLIASPTSLEETLAYISPEQTGRMNHPIDYRTDFYSLGVILYHLFTKQIPFTADTTSEEI